MASASPSCLLCGCTVSHIVGATTPCFLHSLSKDEDIKHINQEVDRIDQQIELLRKKRASFLNRLNEVQSHTYTVPPEILSHVMEIAATQIPPINQRAHRIGAKNRILAYLPLVLSAVSSHWRQVAHSTPRIWTSLRLDLDGYIIQSVWERSMISLLRCYLEKSKNLPLSFAFGPITNGIDWNVETFRPVFDLVTKDNPTRLKAIYTSLSASLDWSGPDGNPNIYPHLQILDLSVPSSFYVFDPNVRLPHFPALQRLTLSRVLTIQLTSTTITYLHLTEVAYPTCNQLLLACQETLTEFHCIKQLYPIGVTPEDNGVYVTLPKLEKVRWDMSENALGFPWDTHMLGRFNLPRLRNITLFNFRPNHARIDKLFSRVTPILSKVCIGTKFDPEDDENGEIVVEEDDFLRLFDFNTRKLELLADGSGSEMISALCALTPSYHPEGQVLIPGLEMLYLSGGDLPPLRRRASAQALDIMSNISAVQHDSPSNDSSDAYSMDEDSLSDDTSESDTDKSSNTSSAHNHSPDFDLSIDNLSDTSSYDYLEGGELLCSTLLKMLEDRLLFIEDPPTTPKDPFILALSFYTFEQQNLKDYERKLHSLVHAGVLKVILCENADDS